MIHAETSFWRCRNPTLWGVAITCLLLLGVVWLAFERVCTEGIFGELICVKKWQAFRNAPPNEIGDALAGFAGVLAFVWIIVTVSLQTAELAAQREILRLTRNEMEEQRKAAQAMAESQRQQADIMRDEMKRRDFDAIRRYVDELIISVLFVLVSPRLLISSVEFGSASSSTLIRFPRPPRGLADVDSKLIFLSRWYGISARILDSELNNGDAMLKKIDTEGALEDIGSATLKCSLILGQISQADSITIERIERLNIHSLKKSLELVAVCLVALEEKK